MFRVIALSALLCGAAARDSHACSHRCFTPWPIVVAPANESTGVPLNAIVHVHLEGGTAEPEAWLVLETELGEPVEVTLELPPWSNTHDTPVRMVPTAPLLPFTRYQVRKVLGPLLGTEDVMARFTTGGAADLQPPSGVELSQVSRRIGAVEECGPRGHTPPTCCSGDFPRGYQPILLLLPAATSEPVTYTLRSDDRIVASDIVGDAGGIASETGALLMESCTPTYHPWEVLMGERHVFTLTPRDVAGNEGPPSAEFVIEEAGCGCRAADRGRARGTTSTLLLFVQVITMTRRLRHALAFGPYGRVCGERLSPCPAPYGV